MSVKNWVIYIGAPVIYIYIYTVYTVYIDFIFYMKTINHFTLPDKKRKENEKKKWNEMNYIVI